jgi:hypothetical protein
MPEMKKKELEALASGFREAADVIDALIGSRTKKEAARQTQLFESVMKKITDGLPPVEKNEKTLGGT